MDRQDKLLASEDKRYLAIDKVNTGLGMLATTEKLGKRIVNFGLPSSAAIFLNLSLKAYKKLQGINVDDLYEDHGVQGIWPDNHTPLFDAFELLITHVVFAFSAIEAFANSKIPDDYVFSQERQDKRCTESYNREQIERHLQLDIKLDKVLPNILQVPSPKSDPLWNKYSNLKKLRDRIIHLKSADTSARGIEDETLWGDLLRNATVDFCNDAHEIIGHYMTDETRSRWHCEYPY